MHCDTVAALVLLRVTVDLKPIPRTFGAGIHSVWDTSMF